MDTPNYEGKLVGEGLPLKHLICILIEKLNVYFSCDSGMLTDKSVFAISFI